MEAECRMQKAESGKFSQKGLTIMFFNSRKTSTIEKTPERVIQDPADISITMTSGEAYSGQEVQFDIRIDANEPFTANQLTLTLRELETSKVDVSKINNKKRRHEEARDIQILTLVNFEEEFPLHGDLKMAQGESRTFTGEVYFPREANPTYIGEMITHEWEVEALLEIPDGSVRKKKKIIVSPSSTEKVRALEGMEEEQELIRKGFDTGSIHRERSEEEAEETMHTEPQKPYSHREEHSVVEDIHKSRKKSQREDSVRGKAPLEQPPE
jgi:hypothetical protein